MHGTSKPNNNPQTDAKMKQDETNAKVLAQLQEYAQLYFEAIIEANTTDGKCDLKPGKYSAKEMVDGERSSKSVLGRAYKLPADSMFDEEVTIEVDTFKCSFPYRRIFEILAKWEAMMRAGKQKAVFEIGEVEEKSAKVILNETTELGSYKEKRIKLQRIVGNWWAPRKTKRNQYIDLYYELNGVMFIPGRKVWGHELQDESTKNWCERYDEAKMSELLLAQVSTERDNVGYWSEVANRAGIVTTATETPEIPTKESQTANFVSEDKTVEIKHISVIIGNADWYDHENRDYRDEYKYYTWLCNNQPGNNYPCLTAETYLAEVRERIATAKVLAAYNIPRKDIGVAVTVIISHWAALPDLIAFYQPQPPKSTPQLPQPVQATNYVAPVLKRRMRPREQPKTAMRRPWHHTQTKSTVPAAYRSIIFPTSGKCHTSNAPPHMGNNIARLIHHKPITQQNQPPCTK